MLPKALKSQVFLLYLWDRVTCQGVMWWLISRHKAPPTALFPALRKLPTSCSLQLGMPELPLELSLLPLTVWIPTFQWLPRKGNQCSWSITSFPHSPYSFQHCTETKLYSVINTMWMIFKKAEKITSCSLERKKKKVDRKGGPGGSLSREKPLMYTTTKIFLTFKSQWTSSRPCKQAQIEKQHTINHPFYKKASPMILPNWECEIWQIFKTELELSFFLTHIFYRVSQQGESKFIYTIVPRYLWLTNFWKVRWKKI